MRGGTYFLCRRKESRQRKRLKPPALKWVPWLGGRSGASGIGALAHSTFVTRQSYFPPRAARSPEAARTETRGFIGRGGSHRLRLGETPKTRGCFEGCRWRQRAKCRPRCRLGCRLGCRVPGVRRGRGRGRRPWPGPWAVGFGFGVRGSGFGVRGSGFGVRGSGFGVRGSGFGARGSGLGARGVGLGAWPHPAGRAANSLVTYRRSASQ